VRTRSAGKQAAQAVANCGHEATRQEAHDRDEHERIHHRLKHHGRTGGHIRAGGEVFEHFGEDFDSRRADQSSRNIAESTHRDDDEKQDRECGLEAIRRQKPEVQRV